MKKWLAIFLVCALMTMASAVAGAAAHEDVTIEFVALSDSTGFIDETIRRFEAANPWVHVEFNPVSGNTNDIKQALITAMVAGDTSPDVYMSDVVWTGQFAAAGWIKDLSGTFDPAPYSEGALQSCMYDGKYFAMPVYTDIQLLVYRSDIIQKEELPKTWDEMLAVCKKYVGTGGVNYGWLWQGAQAEAVVCNATSFFGSNNAGFIEDGKVVCNDKEAVEALQYMYDLIYTHGYSPEDVLSHVPSDTTPIFEQGTALFCTVWPGNYAQMLVDDTSTVKESIGITTMPVGTSGKNPASCTGGWNVAVSSFTDQEEAAMLFAQYLSGAESQVLRTQMNGTLPTIIGLYDDAELQSSVSYLASVKECVAYGKARPSSSDYASLSTTIQEYLHKALTGMSSCQEAMDALAAEIEQYT